MNETRALKLTPNRTVVTSFNPRQTACANQVADYYDDGDWVMACHSTPSYLSCAVSNGEIQIYDPRRLHLVQTIPSSTTKHGMMMMNTTSTNTNSSSMITDLVGAPPQAQADHILVSSSTNGQVSVMDLRQSHASSQTSASLAWSLPGAERALSVSLGFDGNIAAVASNKARIHFYDLRSVSPPPQGGPLASYINAHTDEVTRVRFQHFPSYYTPPPSSSKGSSAAASNSILVSGAEDGLACVFDTTQSSEEAALLSIIHVQTPLRQVGFYGPHLESIFCTTAAETMSLWSSSSTGRGTTSSMQQHSCLAHYSDIRSALHVDYLVQAHWDFARQHLSLLAGCSNGDACVSTISMPQPQPPQQPPVVTTTHRLAGGHRGVVRDWCPLSSSLLVTVGEDARVCEWNLTGRQAHATTATTAGASTMMSNSISSHGGGGVAVRRGSDPTKQQQQQQQPPGIKTGGGPVRRQRGGRFASTPY